MKRFRIVVVALAGAVSVASTSAPAAPVVTTGTDVGAYPEDPRPNSAAAKASFTATAGALGSVFTLNFEKLGYPVDYGYKSLNIGSGVIATGDGTSPGNITIRNTTLSPSRLYGYNTTTGGTDWLAVSGGQVTFSFATPIQAFGAYFTGISVDGETLTFNDGTSQVITLPNPGAALGALCSTGSPIRGSRSRVLPSTLRPPSTSGRISSASMIWSTFSPTLHLPFLNPRHGR